MLRSLPFYHLELFASFIGPRSKYQVSHLVRVVVTGEDVDLSKIQDPHTVCGVMKQYLRELPGTSQSLTWR